MEASISYIAWGNWLLFACAVFYLVWWTMFFAPGLPKPEGALFFVGAGCIVVAAILGLGGVVLGSCGIGELAPSAAMQPGEPFSLTRAIPVWAIVLCGIALYVVLLLVTKNVFARPVTTELALFCGWLTFELCALHVLAGSGALPEAAAYALLAATVLVFAACLVCYVLYYGLDAMPSFIDGAIPLVLVGVASAVIAITAG